MSRCTERRQTAAQGEELAGSAERREETWRWVLEGLVHKIYELDFHPTSDRETEGLF